MKSEKHFPAVSGMNDAIRLVWLEYGQNCEPASLIVGEKKDNNINPVKTLAENIALCLEPGIAFIDTEYYLVILPVGPSFQYKYWVCQIKDDSVTAEGIIQDEENKCGSFSLTTTPKGCAIVWESWNHEAVSILKSCIIDRRGNPGQIKNLTPLGVSAYWPSSAWLQNNLWVAFSTPCGKTEFDCVILSAADNRMWKLNTMRSSDYNLYPSVSVDNDNQLWVTWLSETEQEYYHMSGECADSNYCCRQDVESRRKRKILWNATEPNVARLNLDSEQLSASFYMPSGKKRGNDENHTIHYPSLLFSRNNTPIMIYDRCHIENHKRFTTVFDQLGDFLKFGNTLTLDEELAQLPLPTRSRSLLQGDKLIIVQEAVDRTKKSRKDPETELKLHVLKLTPKRSDLRRHEHIALDPYSFTREKLQRETKAFYGNIHIHTELSICRRDTQQSLDFNYRWAIECMKQDFTAITDHEEDISPGHWHYCISLAAFFNFPGRHIALPAYEWAHRYPDGHMNIYFFDSKTPMRGLAQQGTSNLNALWDKLAGLKTITIAHHTGTFPMHRSWNTFNPDMEPLVEIFQDRRGNYEYFDAPWHPGDVCAEQGREAREECGFVVNALKRGYKLGFCSGGDHMGLSMTGIHARYLSRENIYQSFMTRNCFGVSAPGIDIQIKAVDDNNNCTVMGQVLKVNGSMPTIEVTVSAYTDIASVALLNDGKEISTEKAVSNKFTKIISISNQFDYIYCRAKLCDGNLAWTSPIWFVYND